MTAKTPLISIIVPVYNSEKYLEACVQSILNQTYQNLEILLIDDGSKDSSPKMCDDFAKKDERVKVIHKENGGQADARNLGLEIAKGEYIGFVDSDDSILPEMYESLICAIQTHNCDIAMCGRYNVNEKDLSQKAVFCNEKVRVWEKESALKRFFTWNDLDGSPCDKLFRRDLLSGIRFPKGLICEDIPFVYEVLKNSNCIVHVGAPYYLYLQRTGSTSKGEISKKTLGLVSYPAEIRENAKKEFPQFGKEADYFYFSRELIYIRKLLSQGYDNDAKKRIGIIRKNCPTGNPYFSKYEKASVILMKLNLYLLTRKFYQKRKGKKQ